MQCNDLRSCTDEENRMHQTARVFASLTLSIFIVTSCARHDDSKPKPETAWQSRSPAEIAATLETALPGMMETATIPGLSICLIADFEIVWCAGFGLAEEGAPVTTETIFQAASLSKPVFAYTVLRLVDDGVLDLDTPLLEYVNVEAVRADHLGEDFDDSRVQEITARMVLTHTSGFPNWRRNGELSFLFDPGARFGYSGEGFGLLQKVVERITASSVEELVSSLAFEPLGLTSSTYTASQVDLERYAWPHEASGEAEPRPEDLEDRIRKARPHAAATLMTTAPDYARFLIGLMTGEGLSQAIHADLLRPQSLVEDGGSVAWGLGTGLELSDGGARVWHWGDNNNSKAFYVADPRAGDGVVYFANSYNGLSLVGDILEVAMPGDHPLLEGALLADYPAYDSPDFLLAQAVFADGTEGALRVAQETRQQGNDKPSEAVVNRLGYWLLRHDRVEEAIELFELNVELYPEAFNVYDSLGEAQLVKGLREEGLTNYRRSLELNPDNDNARQVLAEAGVPVD
jgi:CubicO group peptidase (beta-lactamase class C family)